MTRDCLTVLVLAFGVLGHVEGVPSAARAAIIGSEAIYRPYLDGAAGQVFIYAGGAFDENVQADTFTFFGSCSSSGYMTPILFEETASGVFGVRGLGTSRTVTGSSQSQSFDFGLMLGTDLTTNDKYTFGFINALLDNAGEIVGESTGTVDMTLSDGITPGLGLGGAGTTNRWVFTPTTPGLNVHLGTTFGIPFNAAVGEDFQLNDPALKRR